MIISGENKWQSIFHYKHNKIVNIFYSTFNKRLISQLKSLFKGTGLKTDKRTKESKNKLNLGFNSLKWTIILYECIECLVTIISSLTRNSKCWCQTLGMPLHFFFIFFHAGYGWECKLDKLQKRSVSMLMWSKWNLVLNM